VELRETADVRQKKKTSMQAVQKDNSIAYDQEFDL
jgi:hypothetical protein